MNDGIYCPDCGAFWSLYERWCSECGLSDEDLEAAASWLDDYEDEDYGS